MWRHHVIEVSENYYKQFILNHLAWICWMVNKDKQKLPKVSSIFDLNFRRVPRHAAIGFFYSFSMSQIGVNTQFWFIYMWSNPYSFFIWRNYHGWAWLTTNLISKFSKISSFSQIHANLGFWAVSLSLEYSPKKIQDRLRMIIRP